MSLIGKCKGVFILFALLLGAIYSSFFVLPWFLLAPLMFIPWIQSVRRILVRYINEAFFSYASLIILWISGTKITIHANNPMIFQDENVLILCNHRTRVDWIYAGWTYMLYFMNYPCLNFILKEELKYVPFFGWNGQLLMYLFLSRNRLQDLPLMKQKLQYLTQMDASKLMLFLFPEGTDLSESNLQKSHQFSKDKGLPLLNYVLYPRPTGFYTCVNLLRNKSMMIHDITIAYDDYYPHQRTSEISLLNGEFPKEIHLFIHRYHMSEIPIKEQDCHEWLKQSFQQKELLLTSYYQHNQRDLPSFSYVFTSEKLMNKWYKVLWMIGWLYSLHCIAWYWFPYWSYLCFGEIVVFMLITYGWKGLDILELILYQYCYPSSDKKN